MDNNDMDTISEAINALYLKLQNKMKAEWNRDLPFEELLFDRWERAKQLGFASGSNIYHNSYIYGDVQVGEDTWIGPYTLIDGTGGLVIGNSCCISAGVHIYTHDTVKRFVSGGKEPTKHAPVILEDCCYIGPQSVIRGGVTIGKHSIVGACSFVNKNVPPMTIVAGTPAKVVGKVVFNDDGLLSFEYN
jgi:acetyltransferase-like isoleucine patch superfamily enzyme